MAKMAGIYVMKSVGIYVEMDGRYRQTDDRRYAQIIRSVYF